MRPIQLVKIRSCTPKVSYRYDGPTTSPFLVRSVTRLQVCELQILAHNGSGLPSFVGSEISTSFISVFPQVQVGIPFGVMRFTFRGAK